jgi:cytidylate kinase
MPVITISRMYGSGGSEVAARVARALGWQLVDNAFVDQVASRLNVSPAEVAAAEERVPSIAKRISGAFALATPELANAASAAPRELSEESLIRVTERVIHETIARGSAVLVGRGAQSVLAMRSDVFHVFCYAPRDALIARVMKETGVSALEAGRVVDDTNHQREHYVKRNWNRSWRDPLMYHVCLDTEWLGVEGAARVVERLARERFGMGA